MSSLMYDSAKYDIATGAVDLDSDTFYGMLVTSAYTPNARTHAKRSDVTGEAAGAGYTAGGQALTSVTATNDTTNDRLVFASADPSWSSSTITARGLVIYKRRGGAASADNLVCYCDFGADVTSTGGPFVVHCPAAGWCNNS